MISAKLSTPRYTTVQQHTEQIIFLYNALVFIHREKTIPLIFFHILIAKIKISIPFYNSSVIYNPHLSMSLSETIEFSNKCMSL